MNFNYSFKIGQAIYTYHNNIIVNGSVIEKDRFGRITVRWNNIKIGKYVYTHSQFKFLFTTKSKFLKINPQ